MKKIDRFRNTTMITSENNKYDISIPANDNSFRFFPSLNKYIEGNKTDVNLNLTVDKMIIPLELFKQGILGKQFKLNSKAIIKEGDVCTAYSFETDILIPPNAFVTRNISKDDDKSISIAPCQIQIPTYSDIKFEITEQPL